MDGNKNGIRSYMKQWDQRYKFLINLLTGMGAGLSVLSIPFSFNGQFRVAWLFMGLALLVDWLDGSLVRLLGLDPDLLGYDGDRLDEYADLMSYVIAPLMAAVAAKLIPMNTTGFIAVVFVCVVSCLQFSWEETKTEKAFWGWPCYWNFIYFYAWGLDMSSEATLLGTLIFGLATFAPVPYPYPSKFPLQRIILAPLGTIWVILVVLALIQPELSLLLLTVSLLFPLYYLALPLFYYKELASAEEISD